ncbi:hypothetical protein D3C87_826890 [compost metagenome]|jgi:hypothetical protein|uniref:hypothetical protein n=1 Tax=Sphingobacterium TaxID=28453 RepID=UPI000FA4782C|nr:hypothetical protein [Sphingobacterium sp. GVS05A]
MRCSEGKQQNAQKKKRWDAKISDKLNVEGTEVVKGTAPPSEKTGVDAHGN